MSTLDYVKFKNRLLSIHTQAELKNLVTSKIQEIPNFADLKFDVELTLFVCNLIENAVKEKKIPKLDKKQFVLDVIKSLFELSDEEIQQIDSQIEFLHANKKIKSIKFVKLMSIKLYNWVEKKFL